MTTETPGPSRSRTVPVPGMRTSTRDDPDGLSFEIPAKQQLFAMVFLPIWLAGWLAGEVMVIAILIFGSDPALGPKLFLVVWLVFWTLGGTSAALAWLWILSGRERVTLEASALVHRYVLFGLSRCRRYELSSVQNLRVSPSPFNRWGMSSDFRMFEIGGGVVAFDYGASTVRFAASVDEAEGSMIVARMKERHSFPGSAGS